MSNASSNGVWLFLTVSYFAHWLGTIGKPRLLLSNVESTNQSKKLLQALISLCPSLHKLFIPPLFFHNCHMQLMPYIVQSWYAKNYPPYPWESEKVELPDGECTVLDWYPKVPSTSSEDACPIIILNHGIFCNSRDIPGQFFVGESLKRGWTVCVVNRRGHGTVLTKPKYNLFGYTSDLRYVISEYARSRRPKARVFMIGISAGSGIVARYMGEQGMDPLGSASKSFCDAAVGVCPGYNIEVCMGRFRPPYSTMLMDSAKEFHRTIGHELFLECETYQACLNSSNLQEWLDNSWSLGGFSSKKDYYDSTNPMRVVEHIREPSIFFNSHDDPLCVIENVHDSTYLFEKGRAAGAAVVTTQTGSHCAFYEVGLTSWIERAAFEFLDAAAKTLH